MIRLEGRILDGLDEFMLRIGHLTVLCRAACEAGASWYRVEKEASATLTRPVIVPADVMEELIRYLERKRLCVVLSQGEHVPSERDRNRFRYPDLSINVDRNGAKQIGTFSHQPPTIWWQDLSLASQGVCSRVGAITVSAKSGSKTGLSHVADWAQMLGLISKSGEVSPIGRMISRLSGDNPYIIGWERIAFAYVTLSADFDVFSRFILKLAMAPSPIRKSDGTQLFVQALSEVAADARESRDLNTRAKRMISDAFRDLETAGRRSRRPIEETSTAWHRASSRLETYTDFGFFSKGLRTEGERYEYVYHHTERLKRLVSALQVEGDVRSWIEANLMSTLVQEPVGNGLMDDVELLKLLRRLVATLARPAAPLPLEALTLGIVWLSAEEGNFISLAGARRNLESFAVQRPELGRLSRGGYGDRAEFISLDMRKIEELIR